MRSSRMASVRTQLLLGTTLQVKALLARRGRERRLDAVEQMANGKFRDVRGEHAGIELGHVEQGIEQLVHGSDGGIDAANEAGALRRIGLVAELRREQVERVQRLAQVVAGRREKARLGEVGASTSRLRSASAMRRRSDSTKLFWM